MDIASYSGQDTKVWPGKISLVVVAGRGKHSMREVEAELQRGFTTNAVVFAGDVEHQGDLPIIAKKMKLKNKLVRLETDGSNPSQLKKMIDRKVVDYLSLHIPAPLYKDSFEKAGRHDFEKVRESVKIAESSGVEHEIVLDVSGLSAEEVRDAASQITGTLVLYVDGPLGKIEEIARSLEGPRHVKVRNSAGERAVR